MASAALTQPPSLPPHELSAVMSFEKPPAAFVKPFEALSPIMARLPVDEEESVDAEHVTSSSKYLHPRPGLVLPGSLPYSPSLSGVTYTVARLPEIDEASKALWMALHQFKPLTTDYAGDFQAPRRRQAAPHPLSRDADASRCPFVQSRSDSARGALDLVRQAFNWSSIVLPRHLTRDFYGVVFRSKRAMGSESTNLYDADRLAHEEAVASGGLLMYFYGAPDPVTGTNLATCIWSSREEALRASSLPLHAKAAAHARRAYESFELSRYRVTKLAGEDGLRLEEWDDDDN